MSFIAGYLVGLSEGGSDRLAYLDSLPCVQAVSVYGGWEIRLKTGDESDYSHQMNFAHDSQGTGQLMNDAYYSNLYFCIYRNGQIRYAVFKRAWLPVLSMNWGNDADDRYLQQKREFTECLFDTVIRVTSPNLFCSAESRCRLIYRCTDHDREGGERVYYEERDVQDIMSAFGLVEKGYGHDDNDVAGFQDACYRKYIHDRS